MDYQCAFKAEAEMNPFLVGKYLLVGKSQKFRFRKSMWCSFLLVL
jgi:hypothetical protein